MLKLDSHQHFWKYDPVTYGWINEEMQAIRRSFLPADLEPILAENGIDGCIVVQSDQTEQENDFQLQNAAENDFIKGVVGWVDLRARNITEQLEHYRQFEKMKGFRHVLQGEEDRALMLNPLFMNGIKALGKFGFTYDILIFPDQLQFVPALLKVFPDQKFVIDHLAKPDIKNQTITNWAADIRKVAQHQNVYCKISGMVTEADFHHWQQRDFVAYLDETVAAFGTDRIMFGSDWPVCNVAATYKQVLGIVQEYMSAFSKSENDQFFGGTAASFYNI